MVVVVLCWCSFACLHRRCQCTGVFFFNVKPVYVSIVYICTRKFMWCYFVSVVAENVRTMLKCFHNICKCFNMAFDVTCVVLCDIHCREFALCYPFVGSCVDKPTLLSTAYFPVSTPWFSSGQNVGSKLLLHFTCMISDCGFLWIVSEFHGFPLSGGIWASSLCTEFLTRCCCLCCANSEQVCCCLHCIK